MYFWKAGGMKELPITLVKTWSNYLATCLAIVSLPNKCVLQVSFYRKHRSNFTTVCLAAIADLNTYKQK